MQQKNISLIPPWVKRDVVGCEAVGVLSCPPSELLKRCFYCPAEFVNGHVLDTVFYVVSVDHWEIHYVIDGLSA